MDHLTVYYDGHCPVCTRVASWLGAADAYVPLVLVDAYGKEARERCRGLRALGDELVVASDDGRAWVGPAAFLVVGWALVLSRDLVELTSRTPWLLSLAVSLFGLVSANRASLGGLLGVPPCEHGACGLPHPAGPYR